MNNVTTNRSAPVYVSATRSKDELSRPCRHSHPDALETDKCAEKRGANVIVRTVDGKTTVTPAPYVRARLQKQRVVRAAERIVIEAR